MRMTIVARSGARSASRRRPREGVILMVVLGMLTLFAIVGISFAFYADTARRGNIQFHDEARSLLEDTLDDAEGVGSALIRSEGEPIDFRPYMGRIDDLSRRAECLLVKVRQARDRETDPVARRNLDDLARKLELCEAGLADLCWILEQIQMTE